MVTESQVKAINILSIISICYLSFLMANFHVFQITNVILGAVMNLLTLPMCLLHLVLILLTLINWIQGRSSFWPFFMLFATAFYVIWMSTVGDNVR